MPNIVGKIPEFTDDGSNAGMQVITGDVGLQEEVKKATATTQEQAVVEEKETPPEPPAENQPAEGETLSQDTAELARAVSGLQEERVKLLREISQLKGTRRELKQEQLTTVNQQIEELKDVHPEDVAIIDKILRSKGYVTKGEASQMFYDSVKQEELNKFLEKYPEYKPENDSSDINWSTLQRELKYYRMPDNPHEIREILERAHRSVVKVPSDRALPAKKRQVELAGVGAGGTQRSSSVKTLIPHYREELSRGGWSEEEIKQIEKNLED